MSLLANLSVVALMILGFAFSCPGSQRPKQDPPPKVIPGRPAVPPADDEPVISLPLSEDTFSKAMTDLSAQIVNLTSELRMLRKEAERNSTTMELMLNEERLSKVEAKLDSATDVKYQLDSGEADLLRRLRNIQQEVIMRGGAILRREEAEAAVRGELNRALEATRSQRELTNQRISSLAAEAESLRRRIEGLKKKLEPEPKPESSNN
jgi:chromosome segregation ATPase